MCFWNSTYGVFTEEVTEAERVWLHATGSLVRTVCSTYVAESSNFVFQWSRCYCPRYNGAAEAGEARELAQMSLLDWNGFV